MFGKRTNDVALRVAETLVLARDAEVHDLRRQLAGAQGALTEASRRADIAQTNFEWARVRMNQIEAERAQLLSLMLKAPIGALDIGRESSPEHASNGHGLPMYPGLSFDDIGDAEAERAGLLHDEFSVVSNG